MQPEHARAAPSSDAGARPPASTSTLVLLGAPTLGLSLAVTTVAAIVPVLARELTASSFVAGALVGGEGLLALTLPIVLGSLSDRTHTRLGARLPYVIAATPLCVIALVAIPFARSLLGIGAFVLLFLAGYYVYYPPYRALFPDLLPRNQLGRSQGVQTVFREIGLGVALAGSPLMLDAWRPLPFVVSAAVIGGITVVLVARVPRHVPRARAAGERARAPGSFRAILSLLRAEPGLTQLLVANALWELAIGGLRAFIVLYLVIGAHRSHAMASLLMGVVAVIAIIAAPIAGHLADRHGALRIARPAFAVFGVGLLLPAFTSSSHVLLPALPLVGFGGALAMTLPYALFATRLPRSSHGVGSGLYDFSRGVGVLLGPVVTGAAVDLARPWLTGTDGYGAMWLVSGAAVILSLAFIPRSGPAESRTRS